MAKDDYTVLIASDLGIHSMCRRCGSLIGPIHGYPEGAVTPQMAHDAFHATIDELLAEERNV